jgi:hypothetical protein
MLRSTSNHTIVKLVQFSDTEALMLLHGGYSEMTALCIWSLLFYTRMSRLKETEWVSNITQLVSDPVLEEHCRATASDAALLDWVVPPDKINLELVKISYSIYSISKFELHKEDIRDLGLAEGFH